MTSPQLENGFTPIPNELLDALAAYRIPGEQMQCLLVIARKTYGFQKKSDMIANSQFCGATGLKKQHVNRAIKGLIEKKVVTKDDYGKVPTYRINKNYWQWVVSPKKTTVTKNGSEQYPKKGPTKESITKENILSGKDARPRIPFSEIVSYLNKKTGSSFRENTKVTRSHIKARWNEGFILEDFKSVIDSCCDKWAHDHKMVQYLRPQTLFGTKFEAYLQAAGKMISDNEKPCSTCVYEQRGECDKEVRPCKGHVEGGSI